MMLLEPERDDFWRVRSAASATVPFKEWQHFIAIAPGLELLINFSLDGPPGLDREPRDGRVIVLARGRRWAGFVAATPEIDVSRDGCRARFGAHRVEIRGRSYRVIVEAPEHAVFVDATFEPQTVPITARRQAIAPGRHLDWSLTARLAVDARVELAGETFELAGALGYHDHNWGHFAWGDDFTWEWGSVLPRDRGDDWAVVYSNLMNGARTQLAVEQLFVWRRGLNVLAANGLDVRSRAHGRYRPGPALRVPAPMALLHTGAGADVPRRFEATVQSGDDELTLRFAPESVSQVLVPSERSPCRVVAIHECVGPVHLLGRLGGETVEWEGQGVFEFVR